MATDVYAVCSSIVFKKTFIRHVSIEPCASRVGYELQEELTDLFRIGCEL